MLGLLLAGSTFAQETAPDWMVDTLYGSGKINTVVAVVTVILLGLAIWMFTTDRKLRRLEKRVSGKQA